MGFIYDSVCLIDLLLLRRPSVGDGLMARQRVSQPRLIDRRTLSPEIIAETVCLVNAVDMARWPIASQCGRYIAARSPSVLGGIIAERVWLVTATDISL